jgi:hypothetical protein
LAATTRRRVVSVQAAASNDEAPPPLHRLAAAAALAAALLASPSPALADAPISASTTDLLQLDSGLLPSDDQGLKTQITVPKSYYNTVTGLLSSMRDALDADADGAPERDVRRRADPAKERVREFVGKWRDSPLVAGQEYHEEVKAAIAELGAFYGKAGPRAAVTREVRESVLAHLARAEAALPPAEKGVLGF